MTDFAALLRALVEAGVEFILVGGAAATAHGAVRLTLDKDLEAIAELESIWAQRERR